MPFVKFDSVGEMSAYIDGLKASSPDHRVFKPVGYARSIGVSRQGLPKHCKNNPTVFYLTCSAERHTLVVDIGNR